jgi:hypothetical protein
VKEDALLGAGVRVLLLGSGKAGHEINVAGVAEALGAPYERRRVAPRAPFVWMSPFGPVDPREWARPPFDGPAPDVVIGCGRVTVPYLRAFKLAGGRRVFTVFLQDPRFARSSFDLIWVPEHDRHRGPNVITTLTSPHPYSRRRLAAARAAPDPRVAVLPAPRCAVVLGGPNDAQHFTPADLARLSEAMRTIVGQGFSIMATPSRRTTPDLIAAVKQGLGDAPGFVWDWSGDNPYASMLALADAILVTGDSANMVGEATATGAPVHIFEPTGGRANKLSSAIDALVAKGAARRFAGAIESFSYQPIDSSGLIAAEIARRFVALRAEAA